jgi:hypothetical protein
MHRFLDVTAKTTLDFVDARTVGDDWTDTGVAVVDVESPRDADSVSLGLELDPADSEHVPHHADYVTLSPEQARTLAADLAAAADAAEAGDAMTSGRSR